jgi:hypothetical protein
VADIAGLFADLRRASRDDVIDFFSRNAGSLQNGLERFGQKCGRVPLAQCAAASPDRRSHGLDDDGLLIAEFSGHVITSAARPV